MAKIKQRILADRICDRLGVVSAVDAVDVIEIQYNFANILRKHVVWCERIFLFFLDFLFRKAHSIVKKNYGNEIDTKEKRYGIRLFCSEFCVHIQTFLSQPYGIYEQCLQCKWKNSISLLKYFLTMVYDCKWLKFIKLLFSFLTLALNCSNWKKLKYIRHPRKFKTKIKPQIGSRNTFQWLNFMLLRIGR